jgi:hypothetical protein
MTKDKLKNTWKQFTVAEQVMDINKEVSSRAKKAPWYKKPTVNDLNLAYKDAHKNKK